MRRWLVRICVFLLLGAIVTVAVAWGSILLSKSPRMIEHAQERDLRPDERDSLFRKYAQADWSGRTNESGRLLEVWDFTLRFTTGQLAPPTTNAVDYIIEESSYGLPLRTLRDAERWALPVQGSGPGIRVDVNAISWQNRTLPIDVIWPGFAINTVFYAVILWLLFAAPFALRRRRRIKRGLCPKCAYDLRGRPQGSACPECGSIVAS